MDSERGLEQQEAISRTRVELPVTDSIALRQFVPDDAEPLFALIDRNREHLSQFGDTTAQKYPDVEAVLRSITEPPDPDRLRLGIWDGDTLTGTVNLTPRGNDSVVLGYWIGSEFTGQGYATLAVEDLTDYGHEQRGYRRIYAGADPRNERSIAVVERANYVRIGEGTEQVIFVSNHETMTEDERQADKELAVALGLHTREAIYHDGLNVMAMRANGSQREVIEANDMNVLWAAAALALEHEHNGYCPEEVQVGKAYVHPEGTRYWVDEIIENATDFEQTGELSPAVVYTQLTDGEQRPAGSRYVRSRDDFERVFSRDLRD